LLRGERELFLFSVLVYTVLCNACGLKFAEALWISDDPDRRVEVLAPSANYLHSSLSNSTAAILSSQSASPGNPSTFSHASRTAAADICLGALSYMDS